jgi:hypothetical protein
MALQTCIELNRYERNGSQRKRRMSAIQSVKAVKAAKAAKQKKHFKVKKMTIASLSPLSPLSPLTLPTPLSLTLPKNAIDMALITEILFSNEEAFSKDASLDISEEAQTAMMIRCVCKNAMLNKHLQTKRDIYKAEYFYNKLTDMVGDFVMSRRVYLKCSRYDTQGKDTPVLSNDVLETVAIEIVKDNEQVKDAFRELVVVRYQSSKDNYNESTIYKAGFCDYYVQYRRAMEYFGYYDDGQTRQ